MPKKAPRRVRPGRREGENLLEIDLAVVLDFLAVLEDGVDDEMMKKYGVSLTGQLGNEPSDNQRKYSADMEKLFLSLKIVKNNTKDSIGGGGTPRVPLAPDLPVIDG